MQFEASEQLYSLSDPPSTLFYLQSERSILGFIDEGDDLTSSICTLLAVCVFRLFLDVYVKGFFWTFTEN